MNGIILNNISDCWIGNNQVKEIWLSNTKIWPTTHDYSRDYFTIEAISSGCVTIKSAAALPGPFDLYVSKDNGTTWTTRNISVANTKYDLVYLNSGETLLVKANLTSWGQSYKWYFCPMKFCDSDNVSPCVYNVSGNSMSLLYLDDFQNKTTLPGNSTFEDMFLDFLHITSAENLILPATTLTFMCYSSMFSGCPNLVKGPNLPATTLAQSCYSYMFQNCTSLTTAPNLPATTLAESCYSNMFHGCTSLTTAPALPATTLAKSCYSNMFYGCNSLTTAPNLPATSLAQSCYNAMFMNSSSLTTAPNLPATTLAEYCYYYMFYGTGLTKTPLLNATHLENHCYQSMFAFCSNLNWVFCLVTSNNSSTDATTNWLQGTSSTGKFYRSNSTYTWTRGQSGIPEGWEIYYY